MLHLVGNISKGILKCMLSKWSGVWAGLTWLSFCFSCGCYELCNGPAGSVTGKECMWLPAPQEGLPYFKLFSYFSFLDIKIRYISNWSCSQNIMYKFPLFVSEWKILWKDWKIPSHLRLQVCKWWDLFAFCVYQLTVCWLLISWSVPESLFCFSFFFLNLMHAQDVRVRECVCMSVISDYMQHILAHCKNSKMFM